MTDVERAYIAGVLDGEGCITIIRHDQSKRSTRHKSPSYRLAVTIYNTNKAMIDWLAERMEAHRYYKRRKSPNHKVCHMLVVSAKTAATFLRDIQPFVIAKQQQIQLALALQETVNNYRKVHQLTFPGEALTQAEIEKRDAIYQQMRELNNGWKWRRKDFYQSSLRKQC